MQNPADVKLDTEKRETAVVLPEGWKQILGDLKQLKDNPEEIVIFEKSPTQQVGNSETQNLTKANQTPKLENQILRIIISKSKVSYYDESREETIYTNEYYYDLCLFFGNPAEKNGPFKLDDRQAPLYPKLASLRNVYDAIDTAIDKEERELVFCFWHYELGGYPDFCTRFNIPFDFSANIAGSVTNISKRPDSVVTPKYIRLNIQWISPYLFSNLCSFFVKHGCLNETEAQFLETIAPLKRRSTTEQSLITEIQQYLQAYKENKDKSALDMAIQKSQELHLLEFEHSKARYLERFDPKHPRYFNDSHYAFELAEVLEGISPKHAMEALQVYHPSKEGIFGESCFRWLAISKLSGISMGLCGKDSKDPQSSENRGARKKAIHSLNEFYSNDPKENLEKNKSLLYLLELHCGNNPLVQFKSANKLGDHAGMDTVTDKDTRLFKNIPQELLSSHVSENLLSELLCIMGDEIYRLKHEKTAGKVESKQSEQQKVEKPQETLRLNSVKGLDEDSDSEVETAANQKKFNSSQNKVRV